MSQRQRQFRDLVRLNEIQRRSLLDRIDNAAKVESANVQKSGSNARAHTRFEYRQTSLPVAIEHPGGGFGTMLVCARNISEGGMAFVHGGYLHGNTKCKVLLPMLDGERLVLDGRVVNSRHLQGSLHEICVRFDRQVDVNLLVKPEDQQVFQDQAHSKGAPNTVKALCFSDETGGTADARAAAEACGVELHAAADEQGMSDALMSDRYALVMFRFEDCDSAALGLIRSVRKTGHEGPLIVLLSAASKEAVAAAEAAGASRVLSGPFSPEDVRALFDEARTWWDNVGFIAAGEKSAEPGEVDEAVAGSADHLIMQRYVERLNHVAEELEDALEGSSIQKILTLCARVREDWPGAGFENLLATADATMRAVENANVIQDASAQVRQFALLCATAAAPHTG